MALLLAAAALAAGEHAAGGGPSDSYRAAASPAAKPRERPIRVDVQLVLVPVTVTDQSHRPLTGLRKEHFRVFEDQAEQQILQVSGEDAPVSVGLVVDTSGSMAGRIPAARKAVAEFLKTTGPQDELFLVGFADQPRLLCDFTTSTEAVQDRLALAQAAGHTAMLDAVYLAVQHLRGARHARRALVVISDGGDNYSRFAPSEVRELVKEADAQIYAIGLHRPRGPRPPAEEVSGELLLDGLAELSGGRRLAVSTARELSEAAARVGLELHNQYVIAYSPANPASDGRWRKIKVRVSPPEGSSTRVQARSGYYAPGR